MRSGILESLRRSLDAEELIALATVMDGAGAGRQLLIWPDGRTEGDLGSAELDRQAVASAATTFETFAATRASLEHQGKTVDVFVEVHPPPPKLVVIGAVHVAVHLLHFAKRLGYRTVVIDPRTAFATPERFAHADELIAEWPDKALEQVPITEATCFAVLSHDLKIDLPALLVALRSRARYVGALGSKKTHAKRVAALKEAGCTDDEIARIHSPIGLDLGGRKAEEIALSVIAQIVAVGHGR